MSDDKKRPEKIISPKGVAIFPWLNKPDTKFNPAGDYRVRLRVKDEDASALIEKLQQMHDAAVAKAKKDPKRKNKKLKLQDLPFTAELDDDGNETGFTVFSFKRRASGVKKDGTAWAIKPDLFDAKGRKLDPSVQVYGGSVMKVSFTAEPYDTALGIGVSLRLEGAQIIKLVEGQGRSAASYGFGDESDDEDADADTDDESSDESDDDDSDAENGDEF